MSDASQPMVCGSKCGFMAEGSARRDANRGLKYTAEENKQMRAFLIVARQSLILILAKISAKTRQKKFWKCSGCMCAMGGNEIFGSG